MTRVRALDPQGDMQFGAGRGNFISDSPATVAQRAQTRLGLWTGDWYLDLSDGTPYRTAVLGKRVNASRDPAIRARILGTTGAVSLSSYASQINRTTRGFSVQATLQTAYGEAVVSVPANTPNGDVRYVR